MYQGHGRCSVVEQAVDRIMPWITRALPSEIRLQDRLVNQID